MGTIIFFLLYPTHYLLLVVISHHITSSPPFRTAKVQTLALLNSMSMAMVTPMATSLASPTCLQLRLVRLTAVARLRLLPRPPRRLAIRAEASPSPDSFAGWSADGEEKHTSLGFGGLLGAGLAGLFFVAAVTFAALSMKTKTATGTKAQVVTLSRETVTATYSDNICKEDGGEDGEVSFHGDSKPDSTLENETGKRKDPSFVEPNKHCEGRAELAIEHPLQSTDLVPDDKYVIGEEPSNVDDLMGSDVTESPASTAPYSKLIESSEAAFDLSDKLKGAGHSVSKNTDIDAYALDQEGTPNLEERLDSDIPLNSQILPENQLLDDTLTSDTLALDSSGGGVSTQEISDNALESASRAKNQDIRQNPELFNNNGNSPFRMQDDVEYEKTDQMLPADSNDLPAESSKTETVEETLANIVPDLNESESGLEKKSKLSMSTAPDKSFSPAGIPAPSLLSLALQVPPGQVLVPAAVDPTQGNALAALQVLKVIEPDTQPGDLCSRREYARWLVVASNCLSRNNFSKVYPAMYIESMTELAFDDVTPEDPDFQFIQGLAEAGLISSKLSRSDMNISEDVHNNHNLFFPESPLSRQDLVCWKMALDKRQLPEVDRNSLYKASGYIDVDKINAAAWPALAADLSAGDQSITALAFGFTRLFQPDKPVTKGQAALSLSTGDSAEVVMEELARIEAEKIAEAAVNAHGALVAQVEKDLNASFERELSKEREKIETLERLAEEARIELDKLRSEREEEKNALIRGRAAVESELEVLLKLRSEVEEQLQCVVSNKVEISFEKNRIEKLQKEIENENQTVVQLQYELEVERKALSMARAWAEEEAKRAREHAKALEEARNQWERQGIKVVVDGGLQDDASTGVTWANARKEHPVDEAINRAESLLKKLKSMSADIKVKSSSTLERLIQHVSSFISTLKQQAAEAAQQCVEFGTAAASKAKKFADNLQGNVYAFGSTIGDKSKRVVEDCKEGLEKFAHRFKTD